MALCYDMVWQCSFFFMNLCLKSIRTLREHKWLAHNFYVYFIFFRKNLKVDHSFKIKWKSVSKTTLIVSLLSWILMYVYLTLLFHERALDMRWQIVNKARSAKLAITISYPTSASEIIVILKTPKELQYLSSPAIFVDVYRLPNLWSMVYELICHCLLTNQNAGFAIYHC